MTAFRKAALEEIEDYVEKLNGPQETTEFRLLGRDWVLMSSVYDPSTDPGAWLDVRKLPYVDGGSLLEIGCGVGMVAVQAALCGCSRVVASDVSEDALLNTRLNAEKHGVSSRVNVVRSDLFESLDTWGRFDVVYWGAPYVEPPSSYDETDAHPAYFDRNYDLLARYFCDGPQFLAPGGRMFLGFGSEGNWELLAGTARRAGASLEVVAETSFVEEDDDGEVLEYTAWLLEIMPGGGPLPET